MAWTGPGLVWTAGRCGQWATGKKTGPNPTDRGKPGSKHHLLTDANGTPLSAILTGANRHDATQLLPLAVPPLRGQRGRPRRRPERLYADRAYDSRQQRKDLRARLGPAGGRARQRAGGAPVAGGTNPVLAPPVSPTTGALRAACRHP